MSISSDNCDITWNQNPIDMTMDTESGIWEGANESTGDFMTTHIDWSVWCDCDNSTYYLKLEGTLDNGYGDPFSCGPVSATSVDCNESTFELVFDVTCEGCNLTLTLTPKTGASWNPYCA